MAKGMYVGISGKARKIKKGYVGIGGKARKIKKAYVGIGGKARPFWTEEIIEKYGTLDPLSESRGLLTGGVVGNYALFAGGRANSPSTKNFNNVDVYNSQFVHSVATNLKSSRCYLTTGNIGEHVLFAGGEYTNINSSNKESIYSNAVDAYNHNLVKSTPVGISDSKTQIANCNTMNHTLFAGGYSYRYGDSYGTAYVRVDAYNSQLSRSLGSLSTTKCSVAGAGISDYALFAGGFRPGNPDIYYNTVDAFNVNLTRTTAANSFISAAYRGGVGTINGYAVFAGGKSGYSTYYDTVEFYTNALVRFTALSLSQTQMILQTIPYSDFTLFIGEKTTEIYNRSLSKIGISTNLKAGVSSGISWINDYILVGNYSVTAYVVS